jgi:hypothetical protein
LAGGQNVLDDGVHLQFVGEGGENAGLKGADGLAAVAGAVVVGEADGHAAACERFGGDPLEAE